MPSLLPMRTLKIAGVLGCAAAALLAAGCQKGSEAQSPNARAAYGDGNRTAQEANRNFAESESTKGPDAKATGGSGSSGTQGAGLGAGMSDTYQADAGH